LPAETRINHKGHSVAEPQPKTNITTETRRKPFRKKAKATAKAKTMEDKRRKFSNE
jgi:hypothetical protein